MKPFNGRYDVFAKFGEGKINVQVEIIRFVLRKIDVLIFKNNWNTLKIRFHKIFVCFILKHGKASSSVSVLSVLYANYYIGLELGI